MSKAHIPLTSSKPSFINNSPIPRQPNNISRNYSNLKIKDLTPLKYPLLQINIVKNTEHFSRPLLAKATENTNIQKVLRNSVMEFKDMDKAEWISFVVT